MSFWWLENICQTLPSNLARAITIPVLLVHLLSSLQPVVLQEKCGWLHNPSFSWTNWQKHLCSWKYETSVCVILRPMKCLWSDIDSWGCQPVSLRHHWTKFCVVWLSQLTHDLKESWVEFLSLETGELESRWLVGLSSEGSVMVPVLDPDLSLRGRGNILTYTKTLCIQKHLAASSD